MGIKDIITIIISSLAFIVSFASLYKSLVNDKINYIKKECIKLNVEVLEKIHDIEIIDIYKAAKGIGKKDRKQNIDKLFHQLDYYCSNISITRQEMLLFHNKKRIDKIVDYFSGSYIRNDAERIITYTYSKDEGFHFDGPFSIYKSFGVLFKIIDHKIDSNDDKNALYDPSEKYRNAIKKALYINWNDKQISREYDDTVIKLVDIIKENFFPYDDSNDYENILNSFEYDTKNFFDFIKNVKHLYKNDLSEINLSFRSKDIYNKENKYLKEANDSINVERKYDLSIDDAELKKVWEDLDKNNLKYKLSDGETFNKLRSKIKECAITEWS